MVTASMARQSAREDGRASVSLARAVVLALFAIVAVVVWIHWAEIVLGGRRGHTALANTSVPVGAFFAMAMLTAASGIAGTVSKRLRLSQTELLVVYAMCAVSTVLASSGAVHFLVPAVASPYYFATPANKWEVFHRFIPPWAAPRDVAALRGFFEGGAAVPWRLWLAPTVAWVVFLWLYAFCSLGIAGAVQRQWIRHERLTFPTVWVPVLATSGRRFWANRVAWIGMAIPLFIGTLNTLHENFPAVPKIEVRNINLSQHFRQRPWSAIGGLRISFYPFVVGVAFLLSSEVTFSCWFFYLLGKAERILGASAGIDNWGRGGISRFPFDAHQGAGAFIALAAVALYVGRRGLQEALRAALNWKPSREVPVWALLLAGGAFAGLIMFASAAGMHAWSAVVLLGLSLVYLLAATRIRAETGNAWLFGPRLDPHTLMVTSIGPRAIAPRDLTIMAFLSTVSTYDLRCTSMPHQLDAFKIGEITGIEPARMARMLAAGLAVGIPAAWVAALMVWHHVGALAKGDTWRLSQGRHAFELLASYLLAPQPPDRLGLLFVGGGFAATVGLFVARARIVNWPLHPVGYAVANTPSMDAQWFPFLLAWLAKTVILKYGGHAIYRAAVPFFVGMVIGDLLNGGFYTLVGCFSGNMRVYPINW